MCVDCFVAVCVQYTDLTLLLPHHTVMRNQMLNVGFKPYTGWVISSRANRLADKYPQYGREMVKDYAVSDTAMASASHE